MKIHKDFGEKIRTLRKETGTTLEELSFRAEMGSAQLNRIELGKGNPTLSTICKLSSALGVEPFTLLLPEKVPRQEDIFLFSNYASAIQALSPKQRKELLLLLDTALKLTQND